MRRRYDYTLYHKSITTEIQATQDRVKYFLGGAHRATNGWYREVLLMNYLKKVLPSNVSVGTGFVRNGEEVTSQIDLIVYDNSVPTLFSEGDFVVVLPESVYGIIEVKSWTRDVVSAIKKANNNGKRIQKRIFNGIFALEFDSNKNNPFGTVNEELINNHGYLNHISFGSDYFIKYWADGNPQDDDGVSCFSFYKLNNLSFGYFISNLIEFIHSTSRGQGISRELRDFLYPMKPSKEAERLKNWEIKL